MSHRMIHEPDEDQYPEKKAAHNCKPKNDIDRYPSNIRVKNRSIAECDDCGQMWYSYVYSKYNSYSGRTLYHLEWYKLRWYHYKLRRYVK